MTETKKTNRPIQRPELDWFFPKPRNIGDFLPVAYKNWKGLGQEQAQSFRAFVREMKRMNPRFRRFSLFALWLYLCLSRPWPGMAWPPAALDVMKATLEKVDDVLDKLWESYDVRFPHEWVEECTLRKRMKLGLSALRECWGDWADYVVMRAFDWELSPTEICKVRKHPSFEKAMIFVAPVPLLKPPQKVRKDWAVNPFKIMLLEQKICRILEKDQAVQLRDFQRRVHCSVQDCRAVADLAEREGWAQRKTIGRSPNWLVRNKQGALDRSLNYVANLIDICQRKGS